MALFKSAIITDASGSVGGATFSKNKGGLYLRSKTKPAQPNSAKQIAVRTINTENAQAWRELTDAQRQAWREAAESSNYQNALGDTKRLTGQQFFMKANGKARNADPTADTITGPGQPQATSVNIATITAASDGGLLTLEITGSATGAGDSKFCVYLAHNVSPGIQSVKPSAFKKVLTVNANPNVGTAIGANITSLELSATPLRKAWLYIEMVNTVTGQSTKSNVVFDVQTEA